MKKILSFIILFIALLNNSLLQTNVETQTSSVQSTSITKGPIGQKRGKDFNLRCSGKEKISQVEFYSDGYINGIKITCGNYNKFEAGLFKGTSKKTPQNFKGFKGFKARSGSWIDQLSLLDIGGVPQLTLGGTGGGDQGDKLVCPNDKPYLVGVSGSYGGSIPLNPPYPTPYINSLSVHCAP